MYSSELEAHPVYTVSSKPARATQGDLISENQTKPKDGH